MEWVHYQDQGGYSFDHPAGWRVQILPHPACVVSSPDGLCFSLIQPLRVMPGVSPVDVIVKGQFPTATLFPAAKASNVNPDGPDAAHGMLEFRYADGLPGQGHLGYMKQGEFAILCGIAAAPVKLYQSMELTLSRIIRTQNLGKSEIPAAQTMGYPPATPVPNLVGTLKMSAGAAPATPSGTPANMAGNLGPVPKLAMGPSGSTPVNSLSLGGKPSSTASAIPMPNPLGAAVTGAPASHPVSAPPPLPKPVQYQRFTDPQGGTYILEIPMGWRAMGGLHHPQPGDRRAWYEINSPDGIYILNDPMFPHSLCCIGHWPNGKLAQLAGGGLFLSLKPGAESSADCYIKEVGSKRFGGFTQHSRRPRPDVVEAMKPILAAAGVKIGRKGQLTAVETVFTRNQPNGPALVASLLTTSYFSGDAVFGTAFWDSNNILCVSPAHLCGHAENIRTHIALSLRFTPTMMQIYQQDEAQIYANSQAQNAAQWAWFGGVQAAHNAQVAAGDAQVAGYWSQQATNDSIVRGWEQNQAVYDRVSQSRSDEMLDRQRLYDDSLGKNYEAPAGSNYYWRDQQSGNVIGTTTDQPPDYLNNYTQLKKL